MRDSCGQSQDLEFPFVTRYRRLADIMTDQELAALGDSYVNFIFSLALSRKMNKPVGMKVQSLVLWKALRKADVRKLLPHRVDRHKQADAAEAIIVYAWIRRIVTIEESVAILEEETEPDEAFTILLQTILRKVKFS